MPQVQTNAKEALEHVQARYVALSKYGEAIAAAHREVYKTNPNAKIPCNILDAYNRAVNDHLSFGRKVFHLLEQNKMLVEQVIYSRGKPSVDAQGNVRTLRISAPLRPPTFIYDRQACPSITTVSGDSTPDMGAAPLLIPLAMLASKTVAGLLVIGAVGYVSVAILKGVKMVFTSGPDYEPDRQVDAYVRCIKATAEVAEKAGLKLTDEMMKRCSTGQGGALAVPEQGTNWGLVFVVALGIGGVAYIKGKK